MVKLLYFFFLTCCFFYLSCVSQKLSVKLLPTTNINHAVYFPINDSRFDNKKSIVLKTYDTLKRYIQEKFIIENKCNNTNQKLSIGILIGVLDADRLVVVADTNFDNDYTNDSAFIVILTSASINREEFVSLFPIISLEYPQPLKPGISKNNLLFKVYPESNDKRLSFHSKRGNLMNIKNGSITFLILKSFFATKKIKGCKYFFSVIPRNLFLSNDINDTCFFNENNYSIEVVKKSKNKNDSPVFMSVSYGNEISYLNDDSNLHIAKQKYTILPKFKSHQLILQKTGKKESKKISYPLVNYGILTNKNQADTFLFNGNKKLTLIHFTGSWCLPCKISLPYLFEVAGKYSDLMQIVSIQKENDITEAQKYLVENNISWKCYFEQLNCSNYTCFEQKYKIKSYPSFLLFNRDGLLVIKVEGNDDIQRIENFLSTQKIY